MSTKTYTLSLTVDEAVYIAEAIPLLQDNFLSAALSKAALGDTESEHFLLETVRRCSDLDDLHDRTVVLVEAGGYEYGEDGTLRKQAKVA